MMITLRWIDDKNIPYFTRPRTDNDIIFVEVPRNAFTGKPLVLVDVQNAASNDCAEQLLAEYGSKG